MNQTLFVLTWVKPILVINGSVFFKGRECFNQISVDFLILFDFVLFN